MFVTLRAITTANFFERTASKIKRQFAARQRKSNLCIVDAACIIFFTVVVFEYIIQHKISTLDLIIKIQSAEYVQLALLILSVPPFYCFVATDETSISLIRRHFSY